MCRTPNADELVDMLPRERWISATDEITKLFPDATQEAHTLMVGKALQKLNRMYGWAEIDKHTEKRRAYWYIPEGVTACQDRSRSTRNVACAVR